MSHPNVMKISTDKFEFKYIACQETIFRCLYTASKGFCVHKQCPEDIICA